MTKKGRKNNGKKKSTVINKRREVEVYARRADWD